MVLSPRSGPFSQPILRDNRPSSALSAWIIFLGIIEPILVSWKIYFLLKPEVGWVYCSANCTAAICPVHVRYILHTIECRLGLFSQPTLGDHQPTSTISALINSGLKTIYRNLFTHKSYR